jgi:hypothetical protein
MVWPLPLSANAFAASIHQLNLCRFDLAYAVHAGTLMKYGTGRRTTREWP